MLAILVKYLGIAVCCLNIEFSCSFFGHSLFCSLLTKFSHATRCPFGAAYAAPARHLFWQQLRQHQQAVALFRRLREAPKEVPNAAPKEVSEEAERQAPKEAPQRHCPTLDLFSLMCVGLHVNLILVTLFAQFLHFFCILAHTVHS